MFPELTGKKFKFILCRNFFFPVSKVISVADMRVPCSLSQRGRQPKREIPLTPFLGIFINLMRGYRICGMPWRRGRKHDVLEPQERS